MTTNEISATACGYNRMLSAYIPGKRRAFTFVIATASKGTYDMLSAGTPCSLAT